MNSKLASTIWSYSPKYSGDYIGDINTIIVHSLNKKRDRTEHYLHTRDYITLQRIFIVRQLQVDVHRLNVTSQKIK